jgi:chromosomal replication initiator protein
MSNENLDPDSKGLWNRARMICISMMQGDEKRTRAERNFSMIQSVAREGDTFKIFTLNKLSSERFEKEYGEDLRKSFLLAGADSSVKIEITFDETAKHEIVIEKKEEQPAKPAASHEKTETFISTMPLKEYYTFEEFVEGPSNSYVFAAAKGVAKNPGAKALNPLFIHGGTGLGKTHIMQAIGNEIKRTYPKYAVCYLTAEALLNEYVNALTQGRIHDFRERYRKIDVLLIDDIQFIAKNMQNFQEEFFNTFNALTNADKQIVLTSDVPPKDIPGIEERLISRFEGGMLQEVESPGYETRLAILKKKSEGMDPPIRDTTLKFIAANIKSHVRAMEGALSKVNIYANLDPKMQMTDANLANILKDFIEKEKSRKKLTIDEVKNCVCRKYGVTLEQILSTERTQSIVTPRQLAMFISRKFTTRSLPEIAKHFEKSHATIIHGVKNITNRLDVDPELKQTLEEILDELGFTMGDMVDGNM